MSLSERLGPVGDAAREYGQNRSEARLVRMVMAIQKACEGVEKEDPADGPPWAEVVRQVARDSAAAACRAQVDQVLAERLKA